MYIILQIWHLVFMYFLPVYVRIVEIAGFTRNRLSFGD